MPIDTVGGPATPANSCKTCEHVAAQAVGAFRRGKVVGAVEPQSEFVAAQPGDEIGRPDGVAQERRGALQHFVARLVSELVVHRLEAIEVGVEQRARLILAIQPIDVTNQLLEERAPVQQSGQRVGAGLVRHFPLDGLMLQHHPDQTGACSHTA